MTTYALRAAAVKMIYMLRNMQKMDRISPSNYDTPLPTPKKVAKDKNGNYQSSLNGGGGDTPVGKRTIYFRLSLLKASLSFTGKLSI